MLSSLLGQPPVCGVGSRLQLNDNGREALRERVVDIARHAIAFFQYGGLSGLDREHGLVSESLSEFDLRGLIRRSQPVAEGDEAFYLASDKRRQPQNFADSARSKKRPHPAGNPRVGLDVVVRNRTACEK